MAKTPPLVQITHNGVKKPANVPESAVPMHERAGWKRVKPAEKTPEAAKPAPVKPDQKQDKQQKEGDG